MNLKEYREKKGLTVKEMSAELKKIDSRFTPATVSYMENGVVEPPETVRVFLASADHAETELGALEEIVLDAIKGSEEPITRGELIARTGLKDRIIRKTIEGLRGRGYWIVNGSNGGYVLTDNREELKAWLTGYTARAKTIHRITSAMLAYDPQQIEMKVKG